MIDGCKNIDYEKRLQKLNLTTVEERHKRLDMVHVYKVLKDKTNVYPEDFLKLNDRGEGRKKSLKLFKHRVNKK